MQLAPTTGVGVVEWKTPIKKNAMQVPIKEKVELLLGVNADATNAGADFVNSTLFLVNEQKYFASTDGSYIDQDVHRIWLPLTVTAIDKASGKFRTRDGLSAPMGMGYEYLDADPAGKFALPGGVVAYGRSYDVHADAVAAAKQARAKLKAPSVKPGKYDLVLDPSNLFLTIHENVGHPLELDRVLGYEANYAGTSFATLDKRDAGFQYGSELVNLYADKIQPGSLGAVGYDDEGVKTKEWNLIENGKLVDYQAIRDQMHLLGQEQAHGCSYARFVEQRAVPAHGQRVAGTGQDAADGGTDDRRREGRHLHPRPWFVSPSTSSASTRSSVASCSIEIKDGKVTRQIEDVAYQIRTPGILERLRGHLRRARLSPRRLVLRRQGPAGAGLGGVARFFDDALQWDQRDQYGAIAGLMKVTSTALRRCQR